MPVAVDQEHRAGAEQQAHRHRPGAVPGRIGREVGHPQGRHRPDGADHRGPILEDHRHRHGIAAAAEELHRGQAVLSRGPAHRDQAGGQRHPLGHRRDPQDDEAPGQIVQLPRRDHLLDPLDQGHAAADEQHPRGRQQRPHIAGSAEPVGMLGVRRPAGSDDADQQQHLIEQVRQRVQRLGADGHGSGHGVGRELAHRDQPVDGQRDGDRPGAVAPPVRIRRSGAGSRAHRALRRVDGLGVGRVAEVALVDVMALVVRIRSICWIHRPRGRWGPSNPGVRKVPGSPLW